MPNTKTDNNNFSTQGNDQQRDLSAKGGPTSGLGSPDAKHHISKPYSEDIQTQLAAKNKSKMKNRQQKTTK
jgi:hypothetical protein